MRSGLNTPPCSLLRAEAGTSAALRGLLSPGAAAFYSAPRQARTNAALVADLANDRKRTEADRGEREHGDRNQFKVNHGGNS